ncbi:MAG: SAM-dependent methyltransferase [Candidatus Limnocylindrales bacterium]
MIGSSTLIAHAQIAREPGSFRDPSGFVYRRDGVLYRQIQRSFATDWDDLVASGLLATLQTRRMLVDHDLVDTELGADPGTAHAVLRPTVVAFISYPYEWSFGQLRDAALLTLQAQATAAAAGFTLRDATAYNVQFHQGRPILIDTLSFERAKEGAPWAAYKQFCEHFLAPLALMAHRDVRLGLMLRDHLDGIPLDLAATLLPGKTRLNLGLASHIHAHAKAQAHYADAGAAASDKATGRKLSPFQQAALLDSLQRTVTGLSWEPSGTEWADYAEHTSYGDDAAARKDALVESLLAAAGGSVVWDMGANTGRFSRIAAKLGRRVVSWDIDPAATERHYRLIRRDGTTSTLPLVVDLGNPSPALGWAHTERKSLVDRADADLVLALALIHHLAISRNLPLDRLADFFADLAPALIIEFVPKGDPMVDKLLATREDIFPDYTLDGFRAAFGRRFEIQEEQPIEGVTRVLFRLTSRP